MGVGVFSAQYPIFVGLSFSVFITKLQSFLGSVPVLRQMAIIPRMIPSQNKTTDNLSMRLLFMPKIGPTQLGETGVSLNPEVLDTAMNTYYLRSPVAFRQFCNDSYIIQPSPSLMQKIKSEQHVTDGFCPEICIPQETYRGEGTIENDQIVCDEIHSTKGVVVNIKTKEIGDMFKDFFRVNKKIMKNLLDKDEINQMEQPIVHVSQFSFRKTLGS